jgi:superfamily II DNA or RNA helicase
VRVTLGANLVIHHPGRHLEDLLALARWKAHGGYGKRIVTMRRYDDAADTLTLPRGLWPLDPRFGPFEVADERLTLPEVSFRWRGPTLDPFQQRAAGRLYRERQGVLVAPTGVGKTVMALRVLAAWRQPALWMVDTADLFQQAMDAARECYRLPDSAFGTVVDGKVRPGTHFTVAMRQTLSSVRDRTFWLRFGAVFADECDLTASAQARRVLSRFPAAIRCGATATPDRTDRLHPIVFALVGMSRVEVTEQQAVDAGRIILPTIRIVRTGRAYAWPGAWPVLQRNRADDPERNWLIARDVAADARAGHSVLVLVQLVSQAKYLTGLLRSMGISARFVTGQVDSDLRRRRREAARDGRLRVLVATKIINRGVNLPRVDRLYLADPYRSAPTVRQQLGRVTRAFEGKDDAVVVDYWDDGRQFERQQRARKRLYAERGYDVRDDGLFLG